MAGPAEGRVPASRESRQSPSHVHKKPVRSQTNPFGSERFLNSSMRVIINIMNILTLSNMPLRFARSPSASKESGILLVGSAAQLRIGAPVQSRRGPALRATPSF